MPLFPREISGEIDAVRGGRVARVGREGGDLLLVVAGLRRGGLGWTARLRFVEAGPPERRDERSGVVVRAEAVARSGAVGRSGAADWPLGPGWEVEALRVEDARAVLRASRVTGPGDRDVVTVSLPCRAVRIAVRPSLRGTLIRLASI